MPAVWLICDVSGSMVEAGKRFQTRGLVREIEQLVRFGYVSPVSLRLATWGAEVVPYEWNPDDEVPEQILACRDSADVQGLVRFIRENRDDKFLIFTDCHWPHDSNELLSTTSGISDKEAVRIVAVGADANTSLRSCVAFPCHESLVLIEEWLKS